MTVMAERKVAPKNSGSGMRDAAVCRVLGVNYLGNFTTMGEENVNWQRLARHFAGEASPKEERELNGWIKADPSRRLWIEQLRRIWELSQAPGTLRQPAAETDADWKQLRKKMEACKSEASEPSISARSGFSERRSKRRGRRQRHVFLRGRASLRKGAVGLIVCLVVAGAVIFGSSIGEETGRLASASSLREVTTEPGERAKIQMTDGTEVTLNVDSQLRLPNTLDDSVRRVFLQGEAYFDVAAGERPFVVHIKGASVNVHGTAFNVRSYPEERQVQVAVAEGTVSLHPEQEASSGTRLTSGQLGRLDEEKRLVATEKVDVSNYLGWTVGQIVFEDTPLPIVADRLARWYGLAFEIVDSSLKKLRLTARLKSTSIHNVMDVIAATLDLRYEVKEGRVVLKEGRPGNDASQKMQVLPRPTPQGKAEQHKPAMTKQ